jgi:hypothetical protein
MKEGRKEGRKESIVPALFSCLSTLLGLEVHTILMGFDPKNTP